MAQDGGEPLNGDRASAGLRRVQRGKSGSDRNRSASAGEKNTVPVGIADDGPETSGKARSSHNTEQQGQSVHKQAGGSDGQQQKRKRRRSRSRKRRDNASGTAIAQERQNAQPEGKHSHETDRLRSVNGERASGALSEKSDASKRGGGRSQPETDRCEAESHRSHAQSDQGQSPQSQKHQGRKASRRRKRGGRGNEASNAPNAPSQHGEAQSPTGHAHGGTQAVSQPSGANKADAAHKAESGAKVTGSAPQPVHKPQQRPHQPTQAHSHHAGGAEPYAALDLGTNNCRLLVAEPYGQSFRVVDAFSRIVRLGEGLSQSGRLSEEAQDRAIAALKVCQSKLHYRSVKRFRLIATEACRRAANGAAFLNRVHRETGLRLEIVDRETEARLAVAGCASLVHPEADGVVLFDIGGGSSEIVWLDLDPLSEDVAVHPGEKRNRQTRRAMRHLSERIRCWASLQVGVVTLSEKHGGKVVTRAHFETMVEEVRGMLGDFEERDALAKAIETKHIHMLGTSGTVTTLAGVHLGLERYDRRQVDGTWLTATELRDMIGRVLDMNFQERMNNPCIGADRADLVLAGCAILEAFHREWPCPQLRVADRGLREGILMEMMIDDGVWNPQTNQSGKKSSGKKKRSRRRGSRGHRGGHGRAKAT